MAERLTPPISYRDSMDMFLASRPTSTAYGGAADIADATQYGVSGLEERSQSTISPSTTTSNTSSPLRQGLGSRLISNASSSLTRSGTILHSRLKSSISYAAAPRPPPSSLTSDSTTSPPRLTERPRQPSSKFLGGLFDGESAPVRLGLTPTSEVDFGMPEHIMEHRTTFTPRPTSSRQHTRKVSAMSTSSPKSWFSRSVSSSTSVQQSAPSPSPTSSPSTPPPPDEFLTLHIPTALFPHGPADPLAPQSFNDLLLTATSLLTRLQSAYKSKCDALAALQPELEVHKEEVEEAHTRSEHLKLQLEGIGRVCEEQKKVNEELVGQLARTRLEALEGMETIRLVRRSTNGSAHEIQDDGRRRGKRRSAGSNSSVADSGFSEESDGEGEYCGSSVAESQRSDEVRTTGCGANEPRMPPMVLLSSPEYDGNGWGAGGGGGGSDCSSMEAMRREIEASGGVWGTVQSLRHENVDLKMRVESMRLELESCIEMVQGLNMF